MAANTATVYVTVSITPDDGEGDRLAVFGSTGQSVTSLATPESTTGKVPALYFSFHFYPSRISKQIVNATMTSI